MNLNVITEQDAEASLDAVKADESPAPAIVDEATHTPAGVVPQVTADDLYSRLLKYIPAPLIGIYLMATNLIIGGAADGEDPNKALLWIALVFFAGLTLAYLLVRKIRRPVQLGFSVGAFVAFATASPGPFQYIEGWEAWYGTLTLAAVVAVLIVFRPKPLPPDAEL